MDTASFFPTVVGFEEAVKLLNNPNVRAEYHEIFSAVGASSGRAGEAGKRSLLSLHGEEHKRLRSEVAICFRPRSVGKIRPFARQLAEDILAQLPQDEDFDFMSEFAAPYITRTLCEYIGFPPADIEMLSEAFKQMSDAVADLKNRAADWDAGCTIILDYATDAINQRKTKPTDDVLGDLATLVSNKSIDELFAANLIVTLLSAGLEPTMYQIGLLLEEFAGCEPAWRSIEENPDTLSAALEEFLRLNSTSQAVLRHLTTDIAQHNHLFDRDARIMINLSAANRDPRRFGCPHSFDPEANRASHLAFGFGPHHCLGAPLVRAQIQEAFHAISSRYQQPRIVRVEKIQSKGLSGPAELIVQLTPHITDQ